jgi:hypothetical protein
MERPNKLNPASNVVMLQCKTTHNKNQLFVNEAGLSAEKPDQASFATHISDKNNVNFKRNIFIVPHLL